MIFNCVGFLKRLNILYYLFLPAIYSEINSGIAIIFPEKEKKNLLTHEFLNKTKNYNPKKRIEKIFKNKDELDDIEKLQYIYLKTYLPSLFIAEDKMAMAHSIEARMPMCDTELIKFANSIPIRQKLKNNELKSIIKDGMKGIIPAAVHNQEKKGFPTPLGPWLKQGLDKYFREILLDKKAVERKIYNEKYILAWSPSCFE